VLTGTSCLSCTCSAAELYGLAVLTGLEPVISTLTEWRDSRGCAPVAADGG